MLSLSTIPSMAQSEEEAKMAAQQFLQAKKGGVLSKLSTVKVLDGASTAAKVKSTNLSQARGGVTFTPSMPTMVALP